MATQTYDPIASITLSASNSTSVTITNIPQTYTDLVAIFAGTTNAGNVFIRVNSDSGTNYSQTQLRGNGSVAGTSRETSQSGIYIGDFIADPFTGTYSITTINVMNYSNTTTNKTLIVRGNNASKFTDLVTGLWRSTSAINSISVHSSNNNWNTDVTFNLFGIKAGNA